MKLLIGIAVAVLAALMVRHQIKKPDPRLFEQIAGPTPSSGPFDWGFSKTPSFQVVLTYKFDANAASPTNIYSIAGRGGIGRWLVNSIEVKP